MPGDWIVEPNRSCMASDPHVQIRQRFDEVIAEARKNAPGQTALLINKSELEKLSLEEQVRYLYRKLGTVSVEIDNFDTLEYYFFAYDESILYKIYSYRILCNERNEEKKLRDGFLMYEKYRQVNHLLLKKKAKLPFYTFHDFLSNEWNEVFFSLDEQPFGTTDHDYILMRYYQTTKKTCCTTRLFCLLRENFIASSNPRKNIRKHILAEINLLENIYNNMGLWGSGMLVKELSKLKGVKNISFAGDLEEFHRLLCMVMKGDKLNWMLSPQFFNTFNNQIKERKISNPLIFGLTMIMYFRWLSDVLIGKLDMLVKPCLSWNDLYHKALEEGLELAKMARNKFTKMHRKEEMNPGEYMSALNEEYVKYCSILSELNYPDYFYYCDTKEKIWDCFINDCLYSVNIELPYAELVRSTLINDMLVFLVEEMGLLTHNPLANMAALPFDKKQMIEILFFMAPDSTLIRQLLELLAKVNDRCHHKRVPVCFIANDLRDSFNHLFKSAAEKYLQVIGTMDKDKRGCFLLDQLRDIRQIGRLCELEHSKLNPYNRFLKHITKDELENIQGMQPYKTPDISYLFKIKEAPLDKSFSFGYQPGPRPLKPIVQSMHLRMDLFAGDTTADDFMEVLMCEDLSKCTKKIHFGAKNGVLNKFFEMTKPWGKNLTRARIEQSGAFISWKESPVTAHALYNAPKISAEEDKLMNKIFKAKYPKP